MNIKNHISGIAIVGLGVALCATIGVSAYNRFYSYPLEDKQYCLSLKQEISREGIANPDTLLSMVRTQHEDISCYALLRRMEDK